MTSSPFIDFQFWDALRVRVMGRLGCGAVARFCRKYNSYRVEPGSTAVDPSLTFDVRPFEFDAGRAYVFNHYRIAAGCLGKRHRYKIARWRSWTEGLDGQQWHSRLWGNSASQGVIPYQTMTSLVQLRLELQGWHSIHGAAVDRDGRGTVIAGRRGVGKTTLAARMLRRGWSMVGEDRVFLRAGVAMGLRVPVNLKYDRRDPRVVDLPLGSRARLVRNRLIAAATGGFVSLHEPVDLWRRLPRGQVRGSTRVVRMIYLQSGPRLRIEKNAGADDLARRLVLGNRFEDPRLCEDLLAYRFCFPSSAGRLGEYWDESITRLAEELEGCERRVVTVPVDPTPRDWQQLEEEVTH